MSHTSGPTPEKLMQILTGGWAAAVLGAGARHRLFDALEPDGAAAGAVAKKTGISLRGAQALLDGLTGLACSSGATAVITTAPMLPHSFYRVAPSISPAWGR